MKKRIKILIYTLLAISILISNSCAPIVIGGASSGGLILVQERSTKQAGIDILTKTKIEEALFSNNFEDLFSKIRVIVYEGRVLLVGTVNKQEHKTKAEEIAKKTTNVKEIANYISIGKQGLVDYIKDTRISLELKAKLLTDKEVSEVNFTSTTENRILFIIGIAQDEKEINRILQHAADIAGVKKIINLMVEKNDPKRFN